METAIAPPLTAKLDSLSVSRVIILTECAVPSSGTALNIKRGIALKFAISPLFYGQSTRTSALDTRGRVPR